MFNRIRRSASQSLAYLGRIHRRYVQHMGALMAAGVAFYTLLSTIPLLSVAVAVLGWVVGGSEAALWDMKDSIQRYFPVSDDVILTVLRQIRQSKGLLGVLGVAGLLLAASATFTNLEVAFDRIWGVRETRTWWRQRLVAIGTAGIVLVLLFLSVGLTALLTYLRRASPADLRLDVERLPLAARAGEVAGYAISVGLSILMFGLIYRVVPNRRTTWREALVGGAVAGVGWEAAKVLFAVYFAHVGDLSKVYGSLGSLVVLMLWAYYSCLILFFGAEIAADCCAAAEE